MFEDLKPPASKRPKCAAANRVYARELKSGAVIRKFGSAGSPAQAASYTVQSGDTLSQIAQRNGTSVSAIQKANRLSNDRIRSGQKLLIPRRPSGKQRRFHGSPTLGLPGIARPQSGAVSRQAAGGRLGIRYDLRAEVPGQFHALPVTGQAMYVPEIRANGAELRVHVDDAK